MFLLSEYQTVDDADGFHIVIFTQYFLIFDMYTDD